MKQKHTRSRLTYLTCALFFLALLSVAHAADPAPISATELWKAYKTDPAAADKVYKGKTIVVTGSVYFAGVNPISQAINVTLKDDEGKDRIALSALTGEGVDLLRARLRELAGFRQGDGNFSARRRHVLALEATAEHLVHADEALAARAGELSAESLRAAQASLGEITGSHTADDLLGSIFGSFCIGK